MTVRIGTSGWQYADWRGRFYPSAAPTRTWLEHYVSQFDCVEVNSTFYRLPAEGVFAGWAARAPDGFEYALKVSRYITHIRRLGEPAEPIRTFLERAAKLGEGSGLCCSSCRPDSLSTPAGCATHAPRCPQPSGWRWSFAIRHGSGRTWPPSCVSATRPSA